MSHEETQTGGWIRSAVARFEGPLVRYAAHIIGDLERGRDVVQDTFLQLCRQDPSKLDGYLAEWLFTVCRNQAMDVKRKENRMKTLTHEQASEAAGGGPGSSFRRSPDRRQPLARPSSPWQKCSATRASHFSPDQGAKTQAYREYIEVWQRRAGGKGPLSSWSDFCHGLLG